MKIVIAIDNFKIGGAERVASLIANNLAEDNEVHALIFDHNIRYEISDKVIVHIIDIHSQHIRMFRVLYRIKMYRTLLKTIMPDVVYSFGYVGIYAIFANTILFEKIKNVICSERTDPSREPKSRILKLIRNWAYRKCTTLVCQTPDVVDYFRNLGIRVNFSVIPNPVKSDLPSWKGINSNIFMTACRLEPQKNLDMMIEGFSDFSKKFPGYKLHIYGDGYLKSFYEKKIEDMGMTAIVSIYPFTTEIHSIMAKSLAYLSTSDYEGISNSMLEALAIGLPTICTDCPVGGARMFIQNGINGYLCEVENRNSFVDSLCKFVVNPDKYAISNMSMRISDILAPNKIVAEWIKLVK